MERQKEMKERWDILEIVHLLLHSHVMFQEIFKKYKAGRLRFSDIQAWVDDQGGSPLFQLKEQSHALFRNQGKESSRGREWFLDLAIGSIFHEAMKLRENLYQLEYYRPKYLAYQKQVGASPEGKKYVHQFERIISKAGQSLLLSMTEIRSLFEDVMEQLIILFREKSEHPYLVRFLLEHQSLLKRAYGGQKGKSMFNLIFKKGLQEAYDRAGHSYLSSGHYDLASDAFLKALKTGPPRKEFLFLLNFSKGMEAYYQNRYREALSAFRKLLDHRSKVSLKKLDARRLQEVCQKMAMELKEDGKFKQAEEADLLADQIKKMLE